MANVPAYLEVRDLNGLRKIKLDGDTTTIGRNFTNMIVLEENMSSRFHCTIDRERDKFIVRDLDSRNGLLVNGDKVTEAELFDGDVVKIGQAEMKLVVSAKKPIAPAKAAPKPAHDRAMEELAGIVGSHGGNDGTEETLVSTPIPEGASEYEHALREKADTLPDRTFDEWGINMFNARGKQVQADRVRDGTESVLLFRLILLVCFRSRATDIHIEPKNDDVHARARVDGSMLDLCKFSKDLGIKLLSMIKVLSDIDIAQKNIVQEGHFSTRVPNPKGSKLGVVRRVDYRVSFAPSMYGQKLVIRILDEANAPLHIDDLMLPPKARSIIRHVSEQESGMILVCGPTGSGKTTSLYAVLRDIDTSQRNVVTIEDPVEIQLEGVTQTPVNDAQGNTFSVLLRSLLRQDPDVILVGEIRDAETARIAFQAAMTGHLVFSTVHSRDAISGMFRLLDLGVEPFVVASGLHLVLAQRLVRQLCPHCKVVKPATPQQIKTMAAAGVTGVSKLFEPKGCKKCFGTGYRGRRGIYEILMANTALRETLLKSPTAQDCRKALDAETFIPMAGSGYRLAADGVASFDEVEKTVA
jgi:type II secretory ATPase GspE/PulE/Tfp pilus assembly ATPase PilB-like protein